tara:strand:- start:408 stop:740 length:333 start_codon:yes stop_codon:yes gene_type:complete
MAEFSFEDYEKKGKGKRGRKGPGGRNSDRRSSKRKDFRPRNEEERTPHTVICDTCNEECEVPFKPTAGKPIYCDDCFKKNRSSRPNNNNSRGLDEVNKKLDEILSLLKKD